MSHQGSPSSNKRDFSVASLCAQCPLRTVCHTAPPPPRPTWGLCRPLSAPRGRGFPSLSHGESTDPGVSLEDAIVLITQSPLIITSHPTSTERHGRPRSAWTLPPGPTSAATHIRWMDGWTASPAGQA